MTTTETVLPADVARRVAALVLDPNFPGADAVVCADTAKRFNMRAGHLIRAAAHPEHGELAVCAYRLYADSFDAACDARAAERMGYLGHDDVIAKEHQADSAAADMVAAFDAAGVNITY